MTDAETTAHEPIKDAETPVVLVDDLAAEGDYWLSVTDAARVTRRQEITIRRWIATGELPVRRQRMGLNKRTRHVRASDVAKLTPIIDPSATITGAVGNLDLTSIPRQQAQLLAAQQQIDEHMVLLQQQLAMVSVQLEQDRRVAETQLREKMSTLRQELLHLLATLQEQGKTRFDALLVLEQEQQHATEQSINALSEQLTNEAFVREAGQQEIVIELTRQAAELSQLQRAVDQMRDLATEAQQRWTVRLQEAEARLSAALQHMQTQMTHMAEQQLETVQQQWQLQVVQLKQEFAASLQVHIQSEGQQQQRLELLIRRLTMHRRRARRHRPTV